MMKYSGVSSDSVTGIRRMQTKYTSLRPKTRENPQET